MSDSPVAPAPAAGTTSTVRAIAWAALVLAVLAVFVAFARQQWTQSMRRDAVVLERFNALPVFSLTERSAREFGSRELNGKIWLADFIFTTCPGPCPQMSERFYELQQALKRSPDVKLVSFTVWPEYDKPEVLTAYAKRFNADAEKWLFLTGEKRVIYDLAHKGFMLGITDKESGREILKEGEFVHSTKIALVDRRGVVRGYYDSTAPEAVQKILVDVGSLLREQPK